MGAGTEQAGQGRVVRAAALVLALMLALSLLVVLGQQPPSVVPADAPPERFSAARAHERLVRLTGDELPRPIGTEANAAYRERLVAELRGLGLEPEVNHHWVEGEEHHVLRGTSMNRATNVVAVLPSKYPKQQAIMLACHYDSVPAGPGVADDGAAVAACLEVARALLSDLRPQKRPVILLFTDGEEQGLFGARAFCENNPLARKVGLVLNFEARGTGGASLLFETSRDNRAMMEEAVRGLKRPVTSSVYVEVYRRMPNSSDMVEFMEHGLSGMNFAFIRNPKHYHTPLDRLSNLDLRSLQHHGDNALQMTRQLMGVNLESFDLVIGDVVHTDLFGRWILAWPARWSPWLGLAVLLALGAAWRRFRWRWQEVGHALATCALAVLLAAGLGFLAGWALDQIDAPGSSFPADFILHAWTTGIAAGTGALLAVVLLRPRAWILWSTHATVLAALAVLHGFVVPGFSYLFLLPAATSAVMAWIGPRRDGYSHFLAAAALCTGLLSAIVWTPILTGLPTALGTIVAPALGLCLALTLLPVLPLLLLLPRGRLLRAAGAVLGIGAILFGIAAFHPAFTPTSPQQVNLLYLEEAGAPNGTLHVWELEGEFPADLTELHAKRYMLRNPVPESAPQPLRLPGARYLLKSPTLAPPELEEPSTGAGDRSGFRVRRTEVDQQVLVGIHKDSGLQKVLIEGVAVKVPQATRAGIHWFLVRGVPDEGVSFEIAVESPDLQGWIGGITPGIPGALAPFAKMRDGLPGAPGHLGDQSLVYKRFRLTPP